MAWDWTRGFSNHLKTVLFLTTTPMTHSLSIKNPNQIFLLIVTGLVILIPILLFCFQGKLIYLPQMPPGSRDEIWEPSSFGYGRGKKLIKRLKEKVDDDEEEKDDYKWEEVEINSPDGTKLHAYWIKAPSKWTDNSHSESRDPSTPPFTIIYMQANAGNIGHRLPLARKLQESIDCNVLMLSYRGYGRSSGTPSEKGIKLDAQV